MDWQNYLYPFMVLLGIILLIFLMAWVMRRLNHPQLVLRRKQKKIKILEMRQMDPKSKLIEIMWEGEIFLVAINDSAIELLSKRENVQNNDTHLNDT
jgi:flagellar biogenesis protein FliO